MTIEEIRSNAPSGATGYRVEKKLCGQIIYYKGDRYMWLERWKEWIAWDNHNYDIKPL